MGGRRYGERDPLRISAWNDSSPHSPGCAATTGPGCGATWRRASPSPRSSCLLLAIFRLGWIAQFLSKAVVTGFLAGAAIDVVVGELPKLTGTDAEGKNSWRELGSWIGSLGDVHGTTVLVGVLSLAVILGLRFLAPAVPGALVLVAGG